MTTRARKAKGLRLLAACCLVGELLTLAHVAAVPHHDAHDAALEAASPAQATDAWAHDDDHQPGDHGFNAILATAKRVARSEPMTLGVAPRTDALCLVSVAAKPVEQPPPVPLLTLAPKSSPPA